MQCFNIERNYYSNAANNYYSSTAHNYYSSTVNNYYSNAANNYYVYSNIANNIFSNTASGNSWTARTAAELALIKQLPGLDVVSRPLHGPNNAPESTKELQSSQLCSSSTFEPLGYNMHWILQRVCVCLSVCVCFWCLNQGRICRIQRRGCGGS